MGELGRELTNTAPNKKFQLCVHTLTKKVVYLINSKQTNKQANVKSVIK